METVSAAGLLVVAAVTLICGCLLAYRKLRPLFPVHVNCWFCNRDTKVPYGNRNCWDCPNCEQYNGFTPDGDFNKPVPAQFMEDINHPVNCQPTDFLTRGEFLCQTCQRNQLLKIKQLAAFEPLNEATYDEEVAFYQRHLESVYALCLACDVKVQRELQRMDKALQQSNTSIGSDRSQATEKSFTEEVAVTAEVAKGNLSKVAVKLSTVFTFLCAFALVLRGLCQEIPVQRKFWGRAKCQALLDASHQLVLSVCGLSVCIMSKLFLGKDRLFLRDVVHIVAWLASVLSSLPESEEFLQPLCTDDFHCGLMVAGMLLGLEVALALSSRHQTNVTTPIIKRLSLDGSTKTAGSETVSDAVSSVSTSCRRRLLPSGDSGDHQAQNNQPTKSHSSGKKGAAKVSSGLDPGCKAPYSELDTLGCDLSGFSIGQAPSESGYSSGAGSTSSSIFGKSQFGSAASVGLSAGSTFPRPLISPARLDLVRFSNSAGKGGIYNKGHPNTQHMFTSTQPSKMYPGGHYNIFLAQDRRPHSMFAQRSFSKANMKNQSKLSSLPRDKESFGKAPSLFGDSISTDMWLPNKKTELFHTLNISKKNSGIEALWRDSSDVADDMDDAKPAARSAILNKSKGHNVECDSTTPSLSMLTLAKRDRELGQNAHSTFHYPRHLNACSELSDDEEDGLSGLSAPAEHIKWKPGFTEKPKWLVVSVMIAVFSVVVNILLAWFVLSSR